jgi:hypothetical protein
VLEAWQFIGQPMIDPIGKNWSTHRISLLRCDAVIALIERKNYFFGERTDIFQGGGLFTATIEQMSARDSSNTHEVIGELFRAMNTSIAQRATAKLPR